MKHKHKKVEKLSFNSYWLEFVKTCLRPIIRILVRHKVEFKSVVNLIRELYVIEGEKYINDESTNSRGKISSIAYQTGLDRREVSLLLKNKVNDSNHTQVARSREGNILDHWLSNPPFCDNKGKAKPLKRSGPGLSFEMLTQRFGKNISHGPILESLIDAKCVEIIDGKVNLISKAFIPNTSISEAKIEIAANSIKRLSETINHNFINSQNTNFQRNLYSIQIPEENLPSFKKEITHMMRDLYSKTIIPKFEKIEDKYSSINVNKDQCRVGLGFFYFDENDCSTKSKSK